MLSVVSRNQFPLNIGMFSALYLWHPPRLDKFIQNICYWTLYYNVPILLESRTGDYLIPLTRVLEAPWLFAFYLGYGKLHFHTPAPIISPAFAPMLSIIFLTENLSKGFGPYLDDPSFLLDFH